MIEVLYRPEIWKRSGYGLHAQPIEERIWTGPIFYAREAAQQALEGFLKEYSSGAWGTIQEMFMVTEAQ